MLINKMKFMYNLTSQEQYIVNYILKNPSIVFDSTANELAKLTFTSSSTIVRLCKKLGTKGYPDFQLKLALEYKEEDQTKQASISYPNNSMVSGLEIIPEIYEQSFVETRKLINENSLGNIVEILAKAKRIDIYGVDLNYFVAQQASAKWNEVGVMAVAFNSANEHYLTNLTNSDTTVSFVISHTGRNKAMIEIAKKLVKNNMTVIAVTGSRDSLLARICNETILTYMKDEHFKLSKIYRMMSSLFIFDVLYMSSLKNKPEE
ncbi:MurR/RpiR family transcriptional regulator (plasmid) [Niallia taxi]|uniref:MurR/RpiR family transcriptional regulator n=1 Tax=Niallia taxi TaxID=2499688 RepID=UPI003F62CEC8